MMQEFVQEIQNMINDSIGCVHTAFPAKIVSFDTATGLASVLPSMKYKKPDGERISYPQITGVPVVFPQAIGQKAAIAFPVKAGDGCLVIVAEQSIDFWLYGQETDTDLSFDMSNAICIPGLFAKANSLVKEACDNNAVIISSNNAKLIVKNGEINASAANIVLNGNVSVNGNFKTSGGIVQLN